MIISGTSASALWGNATRSLTNGGPAIAASSTAFATLAASSSVDLRPNATHFGETTVAVQTGGGATGASAIQAYDGTNVIPMAATAAAANAAAAFQSSNNNGVGVRINNFDAAVAAHYHVMSYLWVV